MVWPKLINRPSDSIGNGFADAGIWPLPVNNLANRRRSHAKFFGNLFDPAICF